MQADRNADIYFDDLRVRFPPSVFYPRTIKPPTPLEPTGFAGGSTA
jgi:hypothetical protein